MAVLKQFFPQEADYIDTISPKVSRSVTLSTLHGCPPDEIERIASYLISQKGLHTYIKCNPTILGYERIVKQFDKNNLYDAFQAGLIQLDRLKNGQNK